MHIAILGLGYVGATTAACLARAGHHVYGVDINPEKVPPSPQGARRWSSPGRGAAERGRPRGRGCRPVADAGALDTLDMVIICVGTPSRADGKLDLSHC